MHGSFEAFLWSQKALIYNAIKLFVRRQICYAINEKLTLHIVYHL